MTVYEALTFYQEPLPCWLAEFKPDSAFDRTAFFSSRIVYYPGSGTDGQPVKLFGSTHVAHCFVYVDYGISARNVQETLDRSVHHFHGYHTLARLEISQQQLSPRGFVPHIQPSEIKSDPMAFADQTPYAFLEILERDPDLDDQYGAPRLAILFLGADGIASYDALFCQTDSIQAPFAVVLQDHGFGGNYDRFGAGGLLDKIARRSKTLPNLLLVAENTTAWQGYREISVFPDRGGMHSYKRYLYELERT